MRQHRLAAAIALVGLVLAGCDKQASVELKTPAQKASYGIGLNMGKSLAQEGMDDLDSKAVAQGIEDAIGKKEQKLKDEELAEAFAFLQKRAEDRMAKLNEESAAAGKKFLEENYHTTEGARWKVSGSPNGQGGLEYLGEDVEQYKRRYDLKSKEDPKAWERLVLLCKTLNQTPPDQLEKALAPLVDMEHLLKFLALDIALANGDGYWNDGSDFNVYLSESGRFLTTPHDANEGFRTRGTNPAQPDPLVNLTDPNKALRHKLLAVPALRECEQAWSRVRRSAHDFPARMVTVARFPTGGLGWLRSRVAPTRGIDAPRCVKTARALTRRAGSEYGPGHDQPASRPNAEVRMAARLAAV